MNAGNLLPVAMALRGKFPDRKILVAADNDICTKGNPGIRYAKEAVEKARLDGYFFPEGQAGTDWNDYASMFELGEADAHIQSAIEQALSAPVMANRPAEAKHKNICTITADELMKMEIPDIRWAVEGIMPDGCSILAGPPKTGKSIAALNLALAVATGGLVFGKIEVERGDVLYLALEDTLRRLQSRITDSGISGSSDLSRLTLTCDVPRQHNGGLTYIEDWLQEHKNARLVIVDTLQKFRKPCSGQAIYAGDYDAVAAVKQVADAHGVAILLIHHTKEPTGKQNSEEGRDWIDDISGSLGLSGAADTLMVLRRGRNQAQGILSITGRDVEEKELALSLDGAAGWTLLGDAAIHEASNKSRKILDYLQEHEGKAPKEIERALGINSSTVRNTLSRLHKSGAVFKDGEKYCIKAA